MAKIMFQLTPPRPDDPSARMSPQEWIHHQDRRTDLKRQSSFDFDEQKQKKLKLDPQHKESHSTILDYHIDIQSSYEDRDEICATCPLDEFLEETRELRENQQKEINRIPSLIKKIKEQAALITAQDVRITELQDRTESLEAEIIDLKSQVAVLDSRFIASDMARLTMFVANLLLEAVKKLAKIRGEQFPKGNNDPEHSTNRYQQYAEQLRYDDRVKAAWKKDTGLDPVLLKMMRNLKHHQVQRNDAAHETQYEFARLLLSNRYRDGDEHRLYGELFEWVYGMTVEEAAKVEQNPTPFAPDEIGDVEVYLKKKVASSAGKVESGNP